MQEALELKKLTRLLRLAYSAEMAAAYAYRGHWRSLKVTPQRKEIQRIEAEEWLHRYMIGQVLRQLASPTAWRYELFYYVIGHVLGFLCHLSGWFIPMYGAGRLERKNYQEYVVAARYARDGGHPELIEGLLTMAEVEWEHERYFREQVMSHSWSNFVPVWAQLPPKETIQAEFYPTLTLPTFNVSDLKAEMKLPFETILSRNETVEPGRSLVR